MDITLFFIFLLMMTDERTDVRAGESQFEISVGQVIHEFTPVEEVADRLAQQVKTMFLTALGSSKTVRGRVSIKLFS